MQECTIIQFKDLLFERKENQIRLKAGTLCYPFVEAHIAGERKNAASKKIGTSEAHRLGYVSHTQTENRLEIVQRSKYIETKTVLEGYDDCNAVRIYTEIKNISKESQVLEEASAFVYHFEGHGDAYTLTKFTQSHHGECQTLENSFENYGLSANTPIGWKRLSFSNVGSWSTKEELPQGIITNTKNSTFTMFQIQSNNSWCYEIGDEKQGYFAKEGVFYLYLGGVDQTYGDWCKKLNVGETYRTLTVALAFGNSLNDVVGNMTKYRRHIAGKCEVDAHLPPIFNEYMHLSWDGPTEETTAKYAPIVSRFGVEYYVIDCGWHDEVEVNEIYPYCGSWKESKKRFPGGVRKTTDFIRSLGMKPGLWIEPEIIGCQNKEMLAYYDEDCFLQRNGKKILSTSRYFLDFRAKKVVDYMTETIRRMVKEYGAEYIKLDYNQDCGVGTDFNSDSAGEGLEQAAKAYLAWIDDIREQFPNVLFETCSSGGMRMDYCTLSHFSIVSTSDQVYYTKYPYIAGNVLSAVLPEQAAVWSYPVDSFGKEDAPFEATESYVEAHISEEQVIMNMINSFLGRMHLASHLELLSTSKQALIKEGVQYYNSLTVAKKNSVPYMPLGFTRFGEKLVASGIKTEKKLYLAVWNLGGEKDVTIALKELTPKNVCIAYPKTKAIEYRLDGNVLSMRFTEDLQARMFEIDIE